ncbi:MAG: hypothetical protein FWD92_01380 [Methanomassiliicoccaceae archaeon]|nr:hypothetical protein [Methanomassiliicoccaceae archaeon]
MGTNEKMSAAVRIIRNAHKEKTDAVSAAFLSMISGKSIVFIGPNGAGKDLIIRDVCAAAGKKDFVYTISPSANKDEFISKADEKTIIVLDDVFKANSTAMNGIAEMMKSGETVFGSSWDVPSEDDEAYSLYDRFLFRIFIEPLRSDEAFLSFIDSAEEMKIPSATDQKDVSSVKKAAESIPVEDDVLASILSLRDVFKDAGKYISDERWKDSLYAMKVAAVAAGVKSVGISFIPLLQYTLWDWPEEIDDIRKAIFAVCIPGGLELSGLYAEADELLKLSVESKGAVDENAGFPRMIHCYDCNSSFPTLKRLKEHNISRPTHTYADPHIAKSDSQDYVKYAYEELVTLLSSKYGWDLFKKNDGTEKEIFLNEAKTLRERKKLLEENYDNDRVRLMKELENNFWLTEQDRKDMINAFNLRSAQLAEIEGLTADTEFILQ